jgi:hypothetical protein
LETVPIKPLCDTCILEHRIPMKPQPLEGRFAGVGKAEFPIAWKCSLQTCTRVYVPDYGYGNLGGGFSDGPFKKLCVCNNGHHYLCVEEGDAGKLHMRCPSGGQVTELPPEAAALIRG